MKSIEIRFFPVPNEWKKREKMKNTFWSIRSHQILFRIVYQ
jgi:hypothetical protein